MSRPTELFESSGSKSLVTEGGGRGNRTRVLFPTRDFVLSG
jgi:hypothetical protein